MMPDDYDFGKMAQSVEDTKSRVIGIENKLDKWSNIPFRVGLLWRYGWILATVLLLGTVKIIFKIPVPWLGG